MGEITSMAALLCSMISIKLMIIVEGAQVVVAGTIGRLPQPDRVVAMTMGTHKFFVLRVGIVFFSKLSWLIFTVEGMYNGKVVQKAASTVMTTVLVSSKIKTTTARHTKYVAKKVRKAAAYPRKSRVPVS
jgi:hypothetical protein